MRLEKKEGKYICFSTSSGEVMGVFPEPDKQFQLFFNDWLQEMYHINTYGCTYREKIARQNRLKYLQKNNNVSENQLKLENFLPPDTRKKWRVKNAL